MFGNKHIVGSRQRHVHRAQLRFSGICRNPVRVHSFPVLVVRKADGAVTGPLPCIICRNRLRLPVRPGNLQLRDQPGDRPVGAGAPLGAAGTPVPAVRQFRRDGILTVPNQFRYVIRLVLDALMVIRGPGRQNKVTGALPVDPRFVFAAGGDIQAGFNSVVCGENLPEAVHGITFLFLRGIIPGDPPGFPVGNPRLEERFGPFSRLAVLIPKANFPVHPFPVGKHLRIVSVHGRTLDLPAVPFLRQDLISGLPDSAFADPHQAGMLQTDADRVLKVLRPQP